jgi:hypothetical protein
VGYSWPSCWKFVSGPPLSLVSTKSYSASKFRLSPFAYSPQGGQTPRSLRSTQESPFSWLSRLSQSEGFDCPFDSPTVLVSPQLARASWHLVGQCQNLEIKGLTFGAAFISCHFMAMHCISKYYYALFIKLLPLILFRED